jgi:glycosyltransferase involved in cell wall biosynthesis
MRVLAYPGVEVGESNNPYTRLLYGNMRASVDSFSYSRAIRQRYDILHIHWPEWELNVWRNPLIVLSRLRLKLVLIDVMRARGAKLVWTVHNLKAHDGLHPRIERWFWREFIKRLDGYIALTTGGRAAAQERFPALQHIPGFVIPHGHYRGVYCSEGESSVRHELGLPPEARVILFFGQIRPYKNVPCLIGAFRQANIPNTVLCIAGHAASPELRLHLQKCAETDSRVRLYMDAVPRATVHRYFGAADLVVLPFRDILNSGSALLALSLNCPILVPRHGAMFELAAEIGPEWVRTYCGDLTSSELAAALAWAVGTQRSSQAPLDRLNWSELSLQTELAYEQIVGKHYAIAGTRSMLRPPDEASPGSL